MIGMGSRELDNALDRWLTTPDEEESKCKCERCGESLFPGDDYYDCEGSVLCEECSKEWLSEQSQVVTYEMAFYE